MRHLIIQLRKNEAGNALFLILIAVALFAALSYAVTQSGRGGGNTDRETALITSSQMTQYGAGLRTTVTRMSITGTALASFTFTGAVSADDAFDFTGGGAIAQDPPSNSGATAYAYKVPTSSTSGHFLDGIGGDTNADLFMVTDPAGPLASAVCDEINRGLGLSATIATNGAQYAIATADATYDGSTPAAGVIDGLSGEAFGCLYSGTANTTAPIYFHALIEN